MYIGIITRRATRGDIYPIALPIVTLIPPLRPFLKSKVVNRYANTSPS